MFQGDVHMPEQDREHAFGYRAIPDDQDFVLEFHRNPPLFLYADVYSHSPVCFFT
jgi:hypothetical protein